MAKLMEKLRDYNPNFSGPVTPVESVKMMQKVWENASIEAGYGGDFLSHKGDKIWL